MTSMYSAYGAVEPLNLSVPKRVRSDEELDCAAIMLEKLRRKEEPLPPIDDADRVVDVVVDRLFQVLSECGASPEVKDPGLKLSEPSTRCSDLQLQ